MANGTRFDWKTSTAASDRLSCNPTNCCAPSAFRRQADHQRGIFLKLGLRRAQAISVVDVAALIGRDAAGIVTDARIALGSVAATIVRVQLWLRIT